MSRRANVPGILIISAIYWGALLYWKWDALFPDRPVDTATGQLISWGEFFMDYSLMAPFYAILRAVPDKLGGVALMFGAIAILFFLPWLDRSKIRSCNFRPIYKWLMMLFFVDFA